MELMIGEKVGFTDFVLTVCEPRNLRYNCACLFRGNYRQFHLHKHRLEASAIISNCSRQRSRCLSAVHYFKVGSLKYADALLAVDCFNRRCCTRDSIVKCKEHFRTLQYSIPNPLIDLPA